MFAISLALGDRTDDLLAAIEVDESQIFRCTGTADAPLVLAVTGDASGTILSDVRGTRMVVAFGSAVHRVKKAPLADFLHEIAASDDDLSTDLDLDFVAIAADLGSGLAKIFTGTGVHRFFADQTPQGGVWSTSINIVARAKGAALTVSREYEAFTLGFGFVPFHNTVYSGICESVSGSVVNLIDGRVSKVSAKRHVKEYLPGSAATKMLQELEQAIDRQVGDSRDHAVLMGGFDSALVAALLRRRGEPVTTFTFDFGSEKFNQPHVDLVTKTLDTKHVWVPIRPQDIATHLVSLPECMNYPSAKPHYQLHTVIAAKMVAQHGFSHVFTGDGCDAAFLSFPTVNRRARLYEAVSKLPRPLLAFLLFAMSRPAANNHLGHIARLVRSVLRAQLLPWPAKTHLPSYYIDEVTLSWISNQQLAGDAKQIESIRERLAQSLEDKSRVEVAFSGNAITGASRAKVDGAVLSSGLAQSSPFTDQGVKEFLASIPLAELRPDGSEKSKMPKSFLSEMTLREKLLPERVITQAKKSPATSPIDSWYSGPLRPVLSALLPCLPFDCDERAIERLLRPNRLESVYREKATLGLSIAEPIALLASYAAFCKLADAKAK